MHMSINLGTLLKISIFLNSARKNKAEALTSFADNKSPGEDGFTKEFYQTFFDLLCKGSLCVSQKRGTITLIPKGNENLTELKN